MYITVLVCEPVCGLPPFWTVQPAHIKCKKYVCTFALIVHVMTSYTVALHHLCPNRISITKDTSCDVATHHLCAQPPSAYTSSPLPPLPPFLPSFTVPSPSPSSSLIHTSVLVPTGIGLARE